MCQHRVTTGLAPSHAVVCGESPHTLADTAVRQRWHTPRFASAGLNAHRSLVEGFNNPSEQMCSTSTRQTFPT